MQLHFESNGTGFPVIILHGLFGSLDNWHSVARSLSSEFRVITVDQRNHGRSPHHPTMSYPLMAEDIRELMEKLDAQDAHVVGHSMGGKTAMEFSLRYPDRVKRLVVVDIAPRMYSRRHDQILDALRALNPAAFQARHEMEQALEPTIPDRDVRRFLLKNVTRDGEGRFQWQMGFREIDANYDALGLAIEKGRVFPKPCLFLCGGRSSYVRQADEPEIRQMFPLAEMQFISGAGHWVHAAAPTEFQTALREFLERQG